MSLKSCLISKPPLVVFVISLFAFGLTTLFLAFIVKQRNSIANPDTFDWNTFFIKFSDLDICVSEQHQPSSAINNSSSTSGTVNTTSISLSVPFATSFLKDVKKSGEPILLQGSILMDHMDRGRLARYAGMRINLTLDLNMDDLELNTDTVDVCIEISGPDKLIYDLNQSRTRPMTCEIKQDVSKTIVPFKTFTKHHLPHGWCPNGTHLELVYNSNPEWIVFVSLNDRNLIYLHLMCTSAFLFVIAAGFVAFTCYRGVKRPITKVMGDDRGAATLLADSD